MSILFRLLLICGALLSFAYILNKIRKSQITIADSTFWFLFSLGVVILALFPQVAFFFCNILHIESPVNFVYLVIIAILVIRHFMTTVEIARLRTRLYSLVQEQALSAAHDGSDEHLSRDRYDRLHGSERRDISPHRVERGTTGRFDYVDSRDSFDDYSRNNDRYGTQGNYRNR